MTTRTPTKRRMPMPGANEQALINRAPKVLRPLMISLWRQKVRFQFTGWMQYAIPAVPGAALILVAGIFALVGWRASTAAALIPGAALWLITIFDVLTVRYGLHPLESLPGPRPTGDIYDLMRARHSCRSFQRRTLTELDHEFLMESVERHMAEPGLGNAEIRFEYVSGPVTVWPTVNAREFLVAIAPKEYRPANVLDVGYRLQKIVLDATMRGLGTCWIGPGADHGSMAAALGDRFEPARDHIICVAAVGYASLYVPLFIRIFNAKASSTRKPLDSLFFTDAAMDHPLNPSAAPYCSMGRTYEVCQWSPSSYNGQTTRCVVTADTGTVARVDFYAVTNSRYYAMIAVGIWAAAWDLGSRARGHQGRFIMPAEGDTAGGSAQHADPRRTVAAERYATHPDAGPYLRLTWIADVTTTA
jgi:Putative TM nitroreductase